MSDFDTPHGRWPALTVASAGYFFVLLDVTIVNVALAKIGAGLGGSRSELQWVVDAYALVLAWWIRRAGADAPRATCLDYHAWAPRRWRAFGHANEMVSIIEAWLVRPDEPPLTLLGMA